MSQSGVYGTGGSGGGGITTLAGDVGTASGSTVNVITGYASGTPFFTGDNASTLTWQIGDANSNIGLGEGALNNSKFFSGIAFNTAVGDSVANGIGPNCTYNCFFGASAGANLGNRSGGANYNIAIGNLSLYAADAAASYNITLGYLTGGNLQSNESSNIYLNSQGVTSESNTLRIGNATGSSTQDLAAAYICGINGVDLSTAEVVTMANDQLGSATLTAGSGVTITTGASEIIISASGGVALLWNDVPGNSQTMVANNGYVADNAGLCTMTLPVTAAFGTILFVVGNGAGGWSIAQNAGQAVRFGSAGSTTVGVGGSLASTNQYDMIQMLCVVADTDWNVISVTGNITIV